MHPKLILVLLVQATMSLSVYAESAFPQDAHAPSIQRDRTTSEATNTLEAYFVHSAQLQGEWRPGGVIRGQLSPPWTAIFLESTRVRTLPSGAFIIGFGRDAPLQQVLTLTTLESTLTHTFSLAPRTYAVQRINGLPAKKVEVNPQHLDRIYAEYAQARVARAVWRDIADCIDPFHAPLSGHVTGVYGSRRILNGHPRRPHYGIDIAAPTGTAVLAPVGGIVELTHDDMYFSGGTLILNHGGGLSSTFLHLDRILVEVGERVEQGDVIAEVGATGRVTGPHLDWRMNWGTVRVDPTTLLSAQQKQALIGLD